MPDVNAVIAEPSAAAQEATPTFNPSDQNTWSSEQREHWNKTGDIPETPEAQDSAPADKKDAKEVKPEPDGKSAAEPGTAKTQEKQRKPGEKLNAEERISQLSGQVKELKTKLEERDRAREAATQPPAKVETTEKPTQSELKAPVKPKIDDKNADGTAKFKTFEEFDEAKDKYFEDLTDFKTKEALRQADQERAQKASEQVLNQQMTEARKQYADFDEVAGPILKSVFENKEIHGAVKQAINNSPVLPHLLYGLGGNQKQLDNLVALSKSDPIEAIKRLGAIEDLVIQELAKASGAKDQGGDADAGKKSPVETKPRAPKPPSEVGGRGTAPEDALVAAARANDFGSFDAEQTRRARASRS